MTARAHEPTGYTRRDLLAALGAGLLTPGLGRAGAPSAPPATSALPM